MTTRRVPPKWVPHMTDIVGDYRDGLAVKEIRKKFGISYYMLYELLNREGVRLRTAVPLHSKTGQELLSPGRTQ